MTLLLKIQPTERVTLVGKTKSGKSYAARTLLANAPRLVVCDVKGNLGGNSGWHLQDWDRGGYKALKAGRPARVRIPNPIHEGWEVYFEACYYLGNVIVYIDEMYGVTKPSGGDWLKALYTRGRELGIGVWAATQRPTLIPLFALSEVEWIFLFQVRLEQDKKRMATLIGPEAMAPLKGHNLLIFNDEMEHAIFQKQL